MKYNYCCKILTRRIVQIVTSESQKHCKCANAEDMIKYRKFADMLRKRIRAEVGIDGR